MQWECSDGVDLSKKSLHLIGRKAGYIKCKKMK